MAYRQWEAIRTAYCHRLGQMVALEAEVVYPAEFLPDQPPRVLAHRCSEGVNCNLEERGACLWAGTNPLLDPFQPL